MKVFRILAFLLSGLLFFSCLSDKEDEKGETKTSLFRDWEKIAHSDTLKVGAVTSPTDFFIYRDEKFGVEYQKILAFAKSHGLELDVRITQSEDTLRGWVSQGVVDLSITPFAMSKENASRFAFAGITDTLSLVLVQGSHDKSVHDLPDLHKKTLTVIPNSISELRAIQIVEELGDTTVHVARVDTLGQDDLLSYIASKKDSTLITLAESDLAAIYKKQYPGLDISVRASLPIRYSWIVEKENLSLRDSIDTYFSDSLRISHFQRMGLLDTAYKFYFGEPQKVYKLYPGGISAYDGIFKKEAKRLGWHWTVLAAIAAQESSFRANVVGWSGARGLMGIMPSTGRHFGVSLQELLNPEVSVRVAVDLLLSLKPLFKDIPGVENREALVLASYNAGIGHVQDAQRLAEKYGADPKSWRGGVREFMLLKSSPKYYNDPVVRYGYVRGCETVNYVDQITRRASEYKKHIQ